MQPVERHTNRDLGTLVEASDSSWPERASPWQIPNRVDEVGAIKASCTYPTKQKISFQELATIHNSILLTFLIVQMQHRMTAHFSSDFVVQFWLYQKPLSPCPLFSVQLPLQ